MDQTVQQLESQINRSRARLNTNLRELEERVDAATDWRAYVRARPYAALATAIAGGVLLSHVVTRPRPRRGTAPAAAKPDVTPPGTRRAVDVRGQVNDLWHDAATALMGVAAGRITGLIGERIPGFLDEWHRARPSVASRPQDSRATTIGP